MNINDQYDAILQRALSHWGEDVQHQMVIGEIGELLTLYGKKVQGRATRDDWVDEIADVTIMIRQLQLMMGEMDVDASIKRKMDKLNQRLLADDPAHPQAIKENPRKEES